MFILLFVSNNIGIFDLILYLILSNFVLLIFFDDCSSTVLRSGTRILGHHKLNLIFFYSEKIRIMELSVYSLEFESNT